MGRKVFLSFLGTNKYLECNYGNNKNCNFIQEALIQENCSDWSEQDTIYLFLTKDAEIKNWNDNNNFKKGLNTRLKELNLKPEIIPIKNVPEGKSEEEIWEIFNVVFNQLNNEDEIFYDITHGFRSLPMLGIALLNYAKFLKNISVAGIFYGAFEVLGSIQNVKNIDVENRNAPVFDLTAFSVLQDWSVAADNFVNYGNAVKIKKLVEKKTNIILQETKGRDDKAKNVSKLAKELYEFTLQIQTVRGSLLIEGKTIKRIKEFISKIKNSSNEYRVFIPIVQKIEDKIKKYNNDDIYNGFRAVEWCIEHNMIQQGITLIQETIITYILNKFEIRGNDNTKNIRELISVKLGEIEEKKNYNLNNKYERLNVDYYLKIMDNTKNISEISKIFNSLRNHRNNINHGGYLYDFKANTFKIALESSLQSIRKYIGFE